MNQNPYKPPTRKPKSSPKPHFHVGSKEVRDALHAERADPPALAFVGPPPPKRPPSPPTRPIKVLESGAIERGEVPVVENRVTVTTVESDEESAPAAAEPKARGQPP